MFDTESDEDDEDDEDDEEEQRRQAEADAAEDNRPQIERILAHINDGEDLASAANGWVVDLNKALDRADVDAPTPDARVLVKWTGRSHFFDTSSG